MKNPKLSIFLDADGVLWPDVGAGGILDGGTEARNRLIDLLHTVGRRDQIFIGIVTNQTLSARGEFEYEDFRNLVFSLFHALQKESLIDDFRVCFHHPNANYAPLRISCHCRKPRPGMINDLISSYGLLPKRSLILGDRITDVLAGRRANLEEAILLLGPKMLEENFISEEYGEEIIVPFKIAQDFVEALAIIRRWIDDDK